MRTYKLVIAYDGSQYQGWQRQVNTERTIQGTLERSIGRMVGYEVEVHGSGRTDGGVHAVGQTASVVLSGQVETAAFRADLNRYLPEDIRVLSVELMKNGFHARTSAKGKRYEYYIDLREKPEVFTRRYYYHYPYTLDFEAMEEAIGYLIGTHDYAGFTDKKDEKSSVRTIYDIAIDQKGDKIRIKYYGNGFMYHMIRILTGTLLEVGTGERRPEEMLTLLEAKDRSLAGFLVPARGLFLKEVYYD